MPGVRHVHGFKVRRAAQVAAYFAIKQGGSINVLKLAKLIYLADRECLNRYDFPILYDRFVSMDHGPVDSVTLNYINGLEEDKDNWDTYISGREGHYVGISTQTLSLSDLDELSIAEVEILDFIWNQHGNKDQYQLRDFTHKNCLEWEDPAGSSNPIPYERIFKFLGKANSSELARAVFEEMELLNTIA